MRLVHLDDVAWEEWSSPGGKFHGTGRQVSLALGAVPNAHLLAGGHPFDLEHGRLRPGKAGCPCHSHSSQWELFVITRGEGTVRHGDARTIVRAGDETQHVRAGHVWLQPPGTAHQILNTGDVDFVFHVVADNPRADSCYYPDSGKWMLDPQGTVFRMVETTYFDGEE